MKKILIFNYLIITICSFGQNLDNISTNNEKSLINEAAVLDSNIIQIGSQVWRLKNLDIIAFQNGDTILQAKTNEEWIIACENKTPAWCYFDYNKKNDAKYGKLYNWYAVSDYRNLAPEGWKIPSKADFDTLQRTLGGKDSDWKKLASKIGWIGEWGRNESGFNALPSGCLMCLISNSFDYLLTSAFFWTSDFLEKEKKSYILILNGDFPCIALLFNAKSGCSVRCIKLK